MIRDGLAVAKPGAFFALDWSGNAERALTAESATEVFAAIDAHERRQHAAMMAMLMPITPMSSFSPWRHP
jgi:hypothetical protein